MPLSNLSNEELIQIAQQGDNMPRQNDISSMSNEELMTIARQDKERQYNTPLLTGGVEYNNIIEDGAKFKEVSQYPDSEVINKSPVNIGDRLKLTFGDVAGQQAYLEDKFGQGNVFKKQDDNFVVKTNNGMQEINPRGLDFGDITSLPQMILPTIGGVAGAIGGGSIGAAGGPPGIIASGSAGSGIGTGAGEALNQAIGGAIGIRQKADPQKIALETALGMLGEGSGRVMSFLPAATKQVAKTISQNAYIDWDNMQRLIDPNTNAFPLLQRIRNKDSLRDAYRNTSSDFINNLKELKTYLGDKVNDTGKTLPSDVNIDIDPYVKNFKASDKYNVFFDENNNWIPQKYAQTTRSSLDDVIRQMIDYGAVPQQDISTGILNQNGMPIKSFLPATKGGKIPANQLYNNFRKKLDSVIEYDAPGRLDQGDADLQRMAFLNLRQPIVDELTKLNLELKLANKDYSFFMDMINNKDLSGIKRAIADGENASIDSVTSFLRQSTGVGKGGRGEALSTLEGMLNYNLPKNSNIYENIADLNAVENVLNQQAKTGDAALANILKNLLVEPSIGMIRNQGSFLNKANRGVYKPVASFLDKTTIDGLYPSLFAQYATSKDR